MNAEEVFDICVIGGGPAGSTAGSLLAKWGHKVLILEKESFPRHHIGESLLPGTLKIMKHLGIAEQIEKAGYTKKYGATYVWGRSRTPWTVRFAEVVSDDTSYAFQVERATFDTLLLEHSRACGAVVKEKCRAIGFVEENGCIFGVQYVDKERGVRTARCGMCIDASGQSSLLARRLALRELNPALRHIALYAYFRGGRSIVELVPDLSPRDSGNIFIVANNSGWFWYIPMGAGRFSVGFVTGADAIRESNMSKRGEFYRANIARTPEIASLLRDARAESGSIVTVSDWSYSSRRFQGPGFMLVGDAACFVDPILSTGVDLAMTGGLKAAFAINTALADPELARASMEWYEEDYRTRADSFRQMAEHWYHGHRSQESWFWQARRLVDPASGMSLRQAFISLSSGTNGQMKSDHQLLEPYVGGFSPWQLRIMSERLDSDPQTIAATASETSEETGEYPRADPASLPPSASEPTHRLTRETCLRLGDGVRFRPYMSYMSSRDNRLVPVIQMVREGGNLAPLRIVLSKSVLPILEKIDGIHTVGDICEEVAGMLGDVEEMRSKIKNAVVGLLQKLADAKLLDRGRTPATTS